LVNDIKEISSYQKYIREIKTSGILQKIFQDEFHEIGKSLNKTYINKGEETKKKKIRKKILYTT
jgi:FAD synthase